MLYAGQVLTKNLQHALLSPDKLRSELRLKGHCSFDEVFAAILEPTGSWAVITKGEVQGLLLMAASAVGCESML